MRPPRPNPRPSLVELVLRQQEAQAATRLREGWWRIAVADTERSAYLADMLSGEGRCGWCSARLPKQLGRGRPQRHCNAECRRLARNLAQRQRAEARGCVCAWHRDDLSNLKHTRGGV